MLGCQLMACFTPASLLHGNPKPDADELLSASQLLERYPIRAGALLDAIDFSSEGLQDAQVALRENDPETALAILLSYMRQNPLPSALIPELPPARPDILKLAHEAVEGIFTIQSRTYQQPLHPDGRLNWEDRGPNQDKEWAWMLNRHPHFNFLLTAFLETGEARFLETISTHLSEWIPDHPPPNRVSFSTSWRALEAARRILDSWLPVYAQVRMESALSDEALFLMLSAIPEHAKYLRNHYSFWGGNHKVTEKLAIATCALAWPQFREAPQWLQHAVDVIEEELYKQTYPDGTYKELANHYQKVVAENYLRILQMLESRGKDKVDSAFRQRVEALWNNLAVVMRPSGMGPLNSDSSLENNRELVQVANAYFGRSDWKFILTHGTSGVAPKEPASRFFPWAGHAIMRSGWGPDDHWAFFDIGPHGSAHQHWDRLHLSISLGQHDLLVDTGRYIYKPGAMRDYFRYGAGHNVVRVDGRDSHRPPNTVSQPLPVLAQIEPEFDAFAASVDFELGPASSSRVHHRRIVVYLRHIAWLVIDEIVGYGAHHYDTRWNLHPDVQVEADKTGLQAVLADGQFARVELLTTRPGGQWKLTNGQVEPEVSGWYSRAYNERRASTSASFEYRTRQPHINVWWIAPLAEANGNPAPSAQFLGDARSLDSLQVEVKHGTKVVEVTWSGSAIQVQERVH